MKHNIKTAPNIVLFDFDGTLSTGNAPTGFWKYCFAHSWRPWPFIPFMLCGIVLRFIVAALENIFGMSKVSKLSLLWRELLRLFLTPDMVKRLTPGFTRQYKLNRFGWAAEQVAKERAAGNIVVLTSASPSYLILPLVDDMEFDYVICTEMDPRRPWKFSFFNYAGNKIKVLRAILPHLGGECPAKQDEWAIIVRAYSDSKTDMPMMNLAREQVWIDPETGLRKC